MGEKKEFRAAIDCHRKAIALLPDWATAHYSLGKAMVAGGDVDEGLKTMEAACVMAPTQDEWKAELKAARAAKARGRRSCSALD
ncbi:MAG: hypothetical protein ACR2OZ_01730 [Verrucomicrobiales bacterium]